MEVVYLYCAFSYLFIFGFTFEFGAPWYVEFFLMAMSPLVAPLVLGKLCGSMSYYKGDK